MLHYPATKDDLKANAHLNSGNLHQLQGSDDLAFESMLNSIEANSAQAYFALSTGHKSSI